MSETLKQKRVRKMRDRAVRKKNLTETKKKFKEDRELTLHEAHQMTVLCRKRHTKRKLRGFSRFEKVVDEEVEARTWRMPHEPYVPPKEEDDLDDFIEDDQIIDLDELVFDPTEVEEYFGVGFHLVG